MHLERALITGVGSSPLPPARAVRGRVATGAQVGLARHRFVPHAANSWGPEALHEAVNDAGGAEANDRESDKKKGPVSSVPVAVCCLEAESIKAQSEVRSVSRPRRQRGIRMAEKHGEAVGHDCIVLICIFGCGGHGQGTQEVVCVRAGAIVQEQPRGLRVLDARDALETVMFRVLELPSLLDVRVTAKGRAKDRQSLFVRWQRPVPDPDLGILVKLQGGDSGRLLAGGVSVL